MNERTERLLDILAIVLSDERDDLIRDVHKAIINLGYDYDFIAVVNSFRCLLAKTKRVGVRYPEELIAN